MELRLIRILSVQMDVSMPVMGGLEATGLIREYETAKAVPRTPIIALTAHAMIGKQEASFDSTSALISRLGDKERCLEAGMDEYGTYLLSLFRSSTDSCSLIAVTKPRTQSSNSNSACLADESL